MTSPGKISNTESVPLKFSVNFLITSLFGHPWSYLSKIFKCSHHNEKISETLVSWKCVFIYLLLKPLFNTVLLLTHIRLAQPALTPGTLFHAANSLMHIPKLPPPTPPLCCCSCTVTMACPAVCLTTVPNRMLRGQEGTGK